MEEQDKVINILLEISKKMGEVSLNPKQYEFIPIYKHGVARRNDSDIGES